MAELPAPIKRIIAENPDTAKLGTVANSVASAAYRLAYARGYDMASDEAADFIRSQLDAAPGVSGDGSRSTGSQPRSSGSGKVKLSDAEREIAKISGISEGEYAAAKREAQREGVLGRYVDGRGY
jgi:hypothetical protein